MAGSAKQDGSSRWNLETTYTTLACCISETSSAGTNVRSLWISYGYDAEVRLRTNIPLSTSTLQHEVACEYEYEFGFEKRLPPRPENHHFLDCMSSSWISRLVHWLSFDVLSTPGKLEMLFSPSPPSRAGFHHLTIFSPTLRKGNFHVQCKGFSEQTRLEPRYELQRLSFRFVGTVSDTNLSAT